jgi:hypothetical protein
MAAVTHLIRAIVAILALSLAGCSAAPTTSAPAGNQSSAAPAPTPVTTTTTMPAACRDALDRADDVIEEMLDVMTPVLEATEHLADDDVDAAEKNLSDANERFDSGLIDDYVRARDECRR